MNGKSGMGKIQALKPTAYPLTTVLYAIVLLGYFYALSETAIQKVYQLPPELFQQPVPQILLLVFALVVLIELRLLGQKRQRNTAAMQAMQKQMQELLDTKKRLSSEAHIYASHADKLKLFISDKLLEYIEYDEKFLHFKSIASEVRHNGVISYDKVLTALQAKLESENLNPDPPDSDSPDSEVQEAITSLRYLWDLLDLSTADNIALHIAKQVCEAEELLFQTELEDNQDLPDKPVYQAEHALLKALSRCFGDHQISQGEFGRWRIEDQDQVWIQATSSEQLLGNENHLVLVLENIISNAQYFAGRRKGARPHKDARIAIELSTDGPYLSYRIYNRGPHIDADTGAKLFQLGFSTRRVKEHHGKGLGLYFVNEVIKGYDGTVGYRNIENQADLLSLRLAMKNGEVITDVVELVAKDGKTYCRQNGSDEVVESLEWQLPAKLETVEITHQSDQKTYPFSAEAFHNNQLQDPCQKAHPRWSLSYTDRGRRLKLMPQDIAGVEFEIRLPNLQTRLEGDLLPPDEVAMGKQVESIAGEFNALEEYS